MEQYELYNDEFSRLLTQRRRRFNGFKKGVAKKKYIHSEREQIVFIKEFDIKTDFEKEFNLTEGTDDNKTYKLRSLEEVYNGEINFELTPEQFKRLNKIINGIAAKRSGWLQIPKEDIIGELWIKSMEVILRCNQFNPSVIARSCWNKYNDVCRVGKKTRDKVILSSDWMEKIETEDNIDGQTLSTEDDNTSKLYIQDILKLFPEDSEENRYLKVLIFQIGLEECLEEDDIKYLKEIDRKLAVKYNNIRQRRETKIAKLLGYSSESAIGYRNIKDSVKQKLVEKGYKILRD